MPRIGELRSHIETKYLRNDLISGAEARDLVKKVAGDALTATGRGQLEKLKDEYKDKFSDAGMRAFERAFGKAIANSPTLGGAPAGDSSSPLDVRAGTNLDNLPTAFKLSEVTDYDVRRQLRRLDLNLDGFVDEKDMRSAGFSDQQFRMFIFGALLMGTEVDSTSDVPTDLTGKKVLFTGIGDKTKANAWAEAMGAEIATGMSDELDFLFVGNSAGTAKDERAHILNTLGLADIQVAPYGKFQIAANDAGVVSPIAAPLTPAEFQQAANTLIKGWLTDWMTEGYEDAIAYEPARETELRAEMADDIAAIDWEIDAPSDWWSDHIPDRYAAGDPYRDRHGRPIPQDALEVWNVAWGSDLAGIILSVDMVLDKRTGKLVDSGDIMD